MTADASVCDREAELLALGAIAAPGVKIKSGRAQPMDGEIFERMADAEDPERAAGKVRTIVFCSTGKFELQGALANMADA